MRLRPCFVVTLSLAACASETRSSPPGDDAATAGTRPSAAPLVHVRASDYPELVPGGLLCGEGRPMFTTPDHGRCMCPMPGNPPPPPYAVPCPSTKPSP